MSTVIYLVRHAKAGERRTWESDDIDRPLSRTGWQQSEALATRLASKKPSVLLSSPYRRCIQTLEPLGSALGLEVQVDQRLCEDEPFEPVLDLLSGIPDRSVLCSHGDIIPATIAALVRRGLEIQSTPDWRKASTWVLKRSKKGTFSRGKVWPPPSRG